VRVARLLSPELGEPTAPAVGRSSSGTGAAHNICWRLEEIPMHCLPRRVVSIASLVLVLSAGSLALVPASAQAGPVAQNGCWGPCAPVLGPWGSPAPGGWTGPPDPIAYVDVVNFTGYVNLTNAIGYQNVVNAVTYQKL